MSQDAGSYLQNVLGIRNWIRPDGAMSLSAEKSELHVLVWSPFPMTESEKSMATKMLHAVGFMNLVFLNIERAPFSDEQMREWNQDLLGSVGYGVSPVVGMSGPWLELASIHQFLDGSAKGLVDLKRKAWEQLKEFKLKVGRP